MRIGILSLQGAFLEHKLILNNLGVENFEIRKLSDINKSFDGLILPGGESTVMGKLLHELNLFNPLQKMIQDDMPVFGTCAGLVLLSKNILNDDSSHLSTMDITCKRNAYGRQLGSFETTDLVEGIGKVPMRFIRAPYIHSLGKGVETLAIVNDEIVAAKQNKQLVTSFHPELTNDTKIHEYFLNMI